MPATSNRIFVSIAVSKPEGGLEPLPGAITAAKRMAAWATAQGYSTLLLHDGDHKEITVDLLRDRIAAAIKDVTDQDELKRLVVFFAGHGAALAIGDQYWILSNWRKRPTEAVKVSSLQRMLEYYGPTQVSIIGDACQEFSAKFIDVVGSPVLDMPEEDQRPYELDQFFAVDVGKQAFMIKADGTQEDFCLFTEVLLDALEGDAVQASYETIGTDRVVTSQSLAVYLANNVASEAGKHGVRMVPRPKPGFYTDRIYLTLPPPVASSPSSPPAAGGFDADGHVVNADAFDGDSGQEGASGDGGAGIDWDFGDELTPAARSVEKAHLTRVGARRSTLATRTRKLLEQREARRDEFMQRAGSANVRDHFETGCGICVSGADVANVEAASGEVSRVDGAPNWFRIRLEDEGNRLGWTDAVVTLANGHIFSVCVVHGFVAALHIVDELSASLFHRPLGAAEYEGEFAIGLLAKADAGLLDQDDIIDAATSLREGKHRTITLGCIAAQLYDAIRDVDSLRSMASFYALHGQPVPLDIILYGGGSIIEANGNLYADIPAVPARRPRTAGEQALAFASSATPGFGFHPIAGRVPWMRQAWGAVQTARCDKSAEPWRKQALAAMAYLAPGAFTSFVPEGRKAIVALSGARATTLEPLQQHVP